jgi:isopenicillin N synthase-like dioxygenase
MIDDGLPIIDLSDASSPTARQTVGKQLVRSIEQIGFFYVVGHGIEPRLATNAFDSAREFFSLNEAQKQEIAVDQTQRGWMRKGLTQLEGSVSPDVKEVFFWGREVAADDPDVVGKLPLVAPNQWPDASLPHFKQHILEYYQEVMSLGLRLLEYIALGLDQNPNTIHRKYRKPLGRGQLVYYPPISDDELANNAYSAAPHTDFGVLTILLQDSLGGLQAKHQNGQWIDLPPIDGSLVCNVGDLLERWTGGRLPSTIHRVLNSSGKERLSIPIFCDPDSDAWIDPEDFSVSPNQSSPSSVRAGDYISGKNRSNFGHYKLTDAETQSQ